MKARIPQAQGGNMNDMLKKAKQMQEDAANLQAELDEREYTAASGGGLVSVTITGKHQIRSLKIMPEAVDPDDIEMLEDLVAAAVNHAVSQADRMAAEEMEKVTGALNMPGLGGLF